jgi:hypothetical protein
VTRSVPRRPAAMCLGPAHALVFANPSFVAAYGRLATGTPVREVMIDLPAAAFALFDAVFDRGRPLAGWVRRGEEDWRLTAVPRVDPETGEVYGIRLHLRARSDLPIEGHSPSPRQEPLGAPSRPDRALPPG